MIFSGMEKSYLQTKIMLSKIINQGIWSTPWLNKRSQFYLNQISNVVRIAMLHKLGGAYLDSDIISRSSLPVLGSRDPGMAYSQGFCKENPGGQFRKSYNRYDRYNCNDGNFPLQQLQVATK